MEKYSDMEARDRYRALGLEYPEYDDFVGYHANYLPNDSDRGHVDFFAYTDTDGSRYYFVSSSYNAEVADLLLMDFIAVIFPNEEFDDKEYYTAQALCLVEAMDGVYYREFIKRHSPAIPSTDYEWLTFHDREDF